MSAQAPDLWMRDARERVTGSVPFVLHHKVDGMLHARVLRSHVPHGRIAALDVSRAMAHPGVVTVVTGQQLVDDPDVEILFGEQWKDQPVLAYDKVRYVGDPIAIVVANNRATADDALALIDVTYDELEVVGDIEAAAAPGAALVHEEHEGNSCGEWHLEKGNVDQAWDDCFRTYEGTYYSPPASHVPMEPHVTIAQWGNEKVTVWTAAQAPYTVRKALSETFHLEPDNVEVHVFNLGGGYGGKNGVLIEPMAVAASRAACAPVRLELTREEVFQTIGKHAARVWLRTGVDEHGKIIARQLDVTYDAGAYAQSSPNASASAMVRGPGPYHIPHIRVDSRARFTNTVPTGPFRGAMTSQLCWAYESQLDEIADDLGIDPIEIRRRNILRDGDALATGEAAHEMYFDAILDDLERWVAERRAKQAPSENPRGIGVGLMVKTTATPSRAEAHIVLTPDGRYELRTSAVEMGQGRTATMIQIAADTLGVATDLIDHPDPDTPQHRRAARHSQWAPPPAARALSSSASLPSLLASSSKLQSTTLRTVPARYRWSAPQLAHAPTLSCSSTLSWTSCSLKVSIRRPKAACVAWIPRPGRATGHRPIGTKAASVLRSRSTLRLDGSMWWRCTARPMPVAW